MPFLVATGIGAVEVEVARGTLFGVGVAILVLEVDDGWTMLAAEPTRCDSPSNVTRAFSDTQDRLAELKRARMTVPEMGMEKFVWAAAMSRGIESPTVTFVYVSGPVDIVVVVHPDAPDTEHVEPVKPLMQMHEQAPVVRDDIPPF
jgi:hypothetical protein